MKLVYSHNAQTHAVEIQRAGDEFQVQINGQRERAQIISFDPPRVTFLLDGKVITARVAIDGKKRWVHFDGETLVLERADALAQRGRAHGAREGTGSGIVVAPMPGQVRAVLVNEGDVVTEGQPLVLLEAMKMEVKVVAPHDGIVGKISVTEGQSVEREQILAEVVSDR